MLDVKKLLAKLLGAISTIKGNITTINSKLTVTTPSISITASTGTLVTAVIRRWGNVVVLGMTVRNSASVASGGNVFTGTITTTGLRPVIAANGAGYYGNHAIMGRINTDGSITIRNASSTAVSITGTNSTSITVTYIVGGVARRLLKALQSLSYRKAVVVW